MKKLFIYLAILASILIVMGSCATNKMEYISKDYEIYGTWVNPEYDDARTFFAGRFILHPNGSFRGYQQTTDASSPTNMEFVISDRWSDSSGNIWYAFRLWMPGLTGGFHVIAKISDKGKTLEINVSEKDYPKSLVPDDIYWPNYRVYTRK